MRFGVRPRPFETFLATTAEHSSQEHESPFLEDVPISPGNDGIQALAALVNAMEGQPQNKDNPIVLGEVSLLELINKQGD